MSATDTPYLDLVRRGVTFRYSPFTNGCQFNLHPSAATYRVQVQFVPLADGLSSAEVYHVSRYRGTQTDIPWHNKTTKNTLEYSLLIFDQRINECSLLKNEKRLLDIFVRLNLLKIERVEPGLFCAGWGIIDIPHGSCRRILASLTT